MQSSHNNIDALSKSGGFDYIISGAGCAGLSLLHGMMLDPFFDNKKILVIDKSEKKDNDRTWCFWEQQPGIFEPIVHHRWKQLDFYSNYFSARFDIAPYEYKMIRGMDFYQHVLEKAKQRNNIYFLYGDVQSLTGNTHMATVTVNDRLFEASYVFNSIILNKAQLNSFATNGSTSYYYLLQHFKGWLIQTAVGSFDPGKAIFMDFRVDQQHGTTFVYLLPVAEDKALVEYTLFTPNLLQQEAYDIALKDYLGNVAGIKDYEILKEEFGIIPMTDLPFPAGEGNIVHIGTAGGQTKASSGFTFRFIQKHTAKIIDALKNNRDPHARDSLLNKRFTLYDSTLLQILSNKKMGGDQVFSELFKKNPPQRVLRFLDNETSFSEEWKIMRSVPAGIFLPAAIKEMFRKI